MKIIISNKHAYYQFTIIKKFTSGIILQGSEVKSVKDNRVSINEAFCFIKKGEAFIKGMHISEHKESGRFNHNPTRERKLLLNKKEIEYLNNEVKQKGLTIVPLAIILNDIRLIKIELGLAKGKKVYEKRLKITNRIIDKEIKNNLF